METDSTGAAAVMTANKAVATPAGGNAEMPRPVWSLGWLSPWRCRLIFAALIAFGSFSHVRYLNQDCPIDLAGDEAQYWDWSRPGQLDISYYSKGPLVAANRQSHRTSGTHSIPSAAPPTTSLT